MGRLSRPIKVGAVGFDAHARSSLKLVLANRSAGLCELVESPDADVLLLDLDAADGASRWHELQMDDATAAVVTLSTIQPDADHRLWVRKPITVSALVSAIAEAAGLEPGTATAVASTRKAALSLTDRLIQNDLQAVGRMPSRKPAEAEDTFYVPESFLQGRLQQLTREAAARRQPVWIGCWKDRGIAFDPLADRLYTDLSEGQLRNLSVVALDDVGGIRVRHEFIDRASLPGLVKSMHTVPYEAFVWKLTALTARGRAPRGIDLDAPIRLAHWPNLTRLKPLPDAARIVACWVGRDYSPRELAANLRLPLSHVLTLVSACAAVGLVQSAGDATRAARQGKSATAESRRNIFSAMLRKLGAARATAGDVA